MVAATLDCVPALILAKYSFFGFGHICCLMEGMLDHFDWIKDLIIPSVANIIGGIFVAFILYYTKFFKKIFSGLLKSQSVMQSEVEAVLKAKLDGSILELPDTVVNDSMPHLTEFSILPCSDDVFFVKCRVVDYGMDFPYQGVGFSFYLDKDSCFVEDGKKIDSTWIGGENGLYEFRLRLKELGDEIFIKLKDINGNQSISSVKIKL